MVQRLETYGVFEHKLFHLMLTLLPLEAYFSIFVHLFIHFVNMDYGG